jgi:hypothetical protein
MLSCPSSTPHSLGSITLPLLCRWMDLHHYCHTLESIGPALQAGEQAAGSSFTHPFKDSGRKMPVNSTKAATGVCQPSGTIAPLSPTCSNNLFKPHVSLNPNSSCAPFTDTHLKHCAANYSTAGFHSYADSTGTRKNSGQPTPMKTSSVIGPLHPQLGTQRFTDSTTSETV